MDFLLSTQNLPFTGALAVIAAILLIEVFSQFFGTSILTDTDVDVDVDVDFDHHIDTDIHAGATLDSMFDFIGFGRIPFMAWVALFAGVFGIAGLVVNQTSFQIIGAALPWTLSVPAAIIITLPLVGRFARGIAKILPKDETSVITVEQLVGLDATVTYVPSEAGIGRGFAYDKHGTLHNITMWVLNPEAFSGVKTVRLEGLSEQGYFHVTPVG